MSILDKAAFLAARIPPQREAVPEWGGDVHLRVMTGDERFDWATGNDGDNKRAINRLLARCLCDEHGNRLFDDSDEDAAAIGAKDGLVTSRLGKVALRLNGLSDEGKADLKKDSATPSSDSSSTSPAT